MKQIILKPLHHRGQENIGIYFENDTVLNGAIRKHAGAKWSQTKKVWYVPLSKENYSKLYLALKEKANIEQQELHKYLSAKKKKGTIPSETSATIKPVINNASQPQIQKQQSALQTAAGKQMPVHKKEKIRVVNAHVIPAMQQHLRLKAYSSSTIRTYLNEMTQLLILLKDIPADELKIEHLKRYLIYCFEKLQLKENTLHSRINALKFYYEQVLGRDRFFWAIPRPKKPFLLPKLLNESELAKLFNALSNKKHKAMLFTAYSAGLRVSEIVNLKIADVDSKRMQILVQQAKGKKDRYVNLSPVLLDILRKYILEYKPKPRIYLFESEQTLTFILPEPYSKYFPMLS